MTPTDPEAPLRNPLADNLGHQLRQASLATVDSLTRQLAELDLRPIDSITLRLVDANPGCNQAEIGRTLRVQRTNMVPVVNGLVTRGLIDRRRADGRTNALYLTGAGVELHARIMAIGADHDAHFFGDVPPEHRQILIDLFRSIGVQRGQS